MNIFIKKITVFLLSIAGIILFFSLLNYLLINKYKLVKLNPKINSISIGASRTACAINDNYVQNLTNISEPSDPLLISFIKLKTFKHHNPNIKTVFLSLDNKTLSESVVTNFYNDKSLGDKLPNYYNFISTADLLELSKINFFCTVKSSFFIPKISLKLIFKILTKNHNYNILDIGGYDEVNHEIKESNILDFQKKDDTKNYKMSKFEIKNLENIIQFCNKNNMKLILISPPVHPVFYHSTEYSEAQEIFYSFLSENQIINNYWDFSNYELPNSCFADLIHLNDKGAKLFSLKLNELLK